MELRNLINRPVIFYLVKFIAAFLFLYYGTLAVEGLAAPEGSFYSSFVEHYLNYVSWLRASLVYGTKGLLMIFGYAIDIVSPVYFRVRYGLGVHMGYDCLGYGVMSFWLAFVIANKGSLGMKMKWGLAGCIMLWVINVLRISLLLVATNKQWSMPLGLDHHTWFNIFAYIAIFIMIWMYDRDVKMTDQQKTVPSTINTDPKQ